jgi:tetratricopeptide (TPR) repeat protein
MNDRSFHLRKWVVRLTIALLSPMVFFAGLEAALRFFGGRSVGFFQRFELEGREWTMENLRFGQYFFRPQQARVPAWNLIPHRSADTPRIAVLGESAAKGFPLERLGLASMIQGVLETEYPGRQFDTVNACMTAVNSHVLELVVPEIVSHEPDVSVIYMGNNEVVGPYGPGTPFISWGRFPLLIELDKQIRTTKTFALLEDLLSRFIPAPSGRWEGFQMFKEHEVSLDDASLGSVYAAFEKNLHSVVRQLLEGGSKVILCTVAVNLADWGPTARGTLPPDSRGGRLLAEGRSLLQSGAAEKAADLLGQAATAEPQNAEVMFSLGRALQKSGRLPGAREAFSRARDLDRHRFRADSRINDIIRRTAAHFADRDVVLVDADRMLASDGLTDREQFIDHVHFTFEGSLRLGLLVAERIADLFPQWGRPREFGPDDLAELKTRLFFTPFDEVLLARYGREVGNTVIFSSRPEADEVNAHFDTLEKKLRAENSLNAAQLQDAYDKSVAVRPEDPLRDASCADYLWRMGQHETAAQLGLRVFARKPNHFEGLRMAGDVALQAGDAAAAAKYFRDAIRVYDRLGEAWKGLADAALLGGDRAKAKAFYEKAWYLDPSQVGAGVALAGLQVSEKGRMAARSALEEVLRKNPGSVEAHLALARYHVANLNHTEAREYFESALQLDPARSPREYLRFVSLTYSDAEEKKAFATYENRIEGAAELLNNFAWLLATSPDAGVRDPDKALRLARRAVEISATSPVPHYRGTLAAAEAATGDFAGALDSLREARELVVDDPGFLEFASRMELAFRAGRAFSE